MIGEITMSQEKIVEENKKERGATLIEYAVLAALIVIVALSAISLVGTKVSQQFSTIAASL